MCGLSITLRLRGKGGRWGKGGRLKDDKVQAPFDSQPTYYSEVLYSEGNYL